MDVIYLDNNATTKVDEEVKRCMEPYFCEFYGNPSSMHTFGGGISSQIRVAREQVAKLLGCRADEIIFTAGGTESDNTAIKGTLAAVRHKRKVIISAVEHPAVLSVCRDLRRGGYRVVEIPVDKKGRLDLDRLKDELDEDTALVSIMYANNETGTVFPAEKIARWTAEKQIPFHTDAVQTVGKIPLNLSESNIDMLSLSGHKLHGPKGIGALYVRAGHKLEPFMLGGHQEQGKRAGTENVPGIIGLGKACQIAGRNLRQETEYVAQLRDKFEKRILSSCPDSFVNGDTENRLPNTTNISFEYIEGEAILIMLDKFGICASSGSACTSDSLEPSHVLKAMCVPFTAAHGSVRFSLSRYTTEEEIDFAAEKIPPVIKRLRELSPFVAQKQKRGSRGSEAAENT